MAARLIDVATEGRPRIDRYELVAEIASGGMATVFLSRLSGVGGFQRFVAIKRLHPHLAHEEEFVQMFLDEARLAAGIHHPNVVPILEVGASDRGYYLVMEYIEGDTLARLLARATTSGTNLPHSIGLRIVVDTLAGLHAAHELKDDMGAPVGLVHRDVSPQNVLVGVDGISRITDFGVARAASRLSATRAGQLKGKIAYMAPEQAAGSLVDRRADVFAAGIVLWEVLASRRLFKAANEAATLSRVLTELIRSPREHDPTIPEEVARVCMKALDRDVDRRFASCAQFADALERATGSNGFRIAPPREAAAYVSEVIGNEIAQQREAVRAWLARSEPSRVEHPSSGQSSTVSAAAMAIPRDEATRPQRPDSGLSIPPEQKPHRGRRAVLVGAALLGLGGLVYGSMRIGASMAVPSTGSPSIGELPASGPSSAANSPAATPTEPPTPTEQPDSDSGDDKRLDEPGPPDPSSVTDQRPQMAKPKPSAKAEPTTGPKAEPEAEPKPEPKAEPRPEPKPKPDSELPANPYFR